MSAARVQNNFSNRAKARLAVERKTIFKSVLDNPFQVKWSVLPPLSRRLSHHSKAICSNKLAKYLLSALIGVSGVPPAS